MVKGLSNGAQNLPVDVTKLIDQLLSPPWFSDYLLSKSTYYDLQLAREEMRKQRPHYLEAWFTLYIEAIALVEEYLSATSFAANLHETNPVKSRSGLERI